MTNRSPIFSSLSATLAGILVLPAYWASANPVLPGADPHAMVVDNTVWIYPTFSGNQRGQRFFAFSSTNLTDWHRHGPVLEFDDVSWIGDDGQRRHYAWAPCVIANKGRYYFYFSVGPQNPTPSRLGVAVGDSAKGPFHDSGKPLLTGGDGFEAIDPMVFADPQSDKHYLYAGGSAGATLRVFELDPDLTSLAQEVPVENPPQFTEAPFMHVNDGVYYLSYSHGHWRDASYSVHYATSDSPLGPWKYQGPILTSDSARKGPGHHSFIRSPLTDEWLIVYHRWENVSGNGPYRGTRQIAIDRVSYHDDGRIQPIAMTGKPTPSAPPRRHSGSTPIPAPSEQTREYKNLAYVTDGHERQQLDLYLPGNGRDWPLIVWVHGGAWRGGSKDSPQALFLRPHGFAVAILNYPSTYASADDPPFLIMHGEEDPLVAIGQSELLHDALKQAGAETTFRRISGAGHGFGGPEINQMVLEFFQRHLQ